MIPVGYDVAWTFTSSMNLDPSGTECHRSKTSSHLRNDITGITCGF